MNYIISGDTEEYKDCLIYVIRGGRELAESVLNRMLTNPNEDDKRELKTHFNIRIKEVENRDAWWNDPFLVN